MKPTHVLAAAAVLGGLLMVPAVASAAEATFDRTLSVSPNVNVYVSTGSGYVHISPGSDNQIHIIGHVKSGHGGWWDGGSPDDRVKQIAANPPSGAPSPPAAANRPSDASANMMPSGIPLAVSG